MTMAALIGELGGEVLGAETVLLALPTWRANAAETLAEAVGDLARRAPRVVAVLVEAHTFAGTDRAPRLEPAAVDALADELASRGVLVHRLAADSELEVLQRAAAGAIR